MHNLHTKDGKMYIIGESSDFLYMIEQEIGLEARRVASEYVHYIEDKNAYEEAMAKTDAEAYEAEVEELQRMMMDVANEILELMDELGDKGKLTRMKTITELNKIHSKIMKEL